MLVKCGICSYSGNVWDYEVWTRHGTYPKLWICDTCFVKIKYNLEDGEQ